MEPTYSLWFSRFCACLLRLFCSSRSNSPSRKSYSGKMSPFSCYLHMSGYAGVAEQDVPITELNYVDCKAQMFIAEGPRWPFGRGPSVLFPTSLSLPTWPMSNYLPTLNNNMVTLEVRFFTFSRVCWSLFLFSFLFVFYCCKLSICQRSD